MAKYNVYFDENCHLRMANGNDKVGKGIWCLNTIAGHEIMTLKDGTELCNITGTCEGCDGSCGKDCYAIRNQKYRNKNFTTWARNTILAKEFVEILFEELQEFIDRNMIAAIRYHSFGEIPSKKYLEAMIAIAEKNPSIQFYTYTKRYAWVEEVLSEREMPNNLVINISIWHKNYANPLNLPEFIYDDGTEEDVAKLVHCPAVDKTGHETGITCAQCKRCLYAKNGQKTAVYAH